MTNLLCERTYDPPSAGLCSCEDADVSGVGELNDPLSIFPRDNASIGAASTEIRVSVVGMLSDVDSGMDGSDGRRSSWVSQC